MGLGRLQRALQSEGEGEGTLRRSEEAGRFEGEESAARPCVPLARVREGRLPAPRPASVSPLHQSAFVRRLR